MITVYSELSKRPESQVLAIPFWEKPKSASPLSKEIKNAFNHPLHTPDFQGKEKDLLLHYTDACQEGRILLFGLGKEEEITLEKLRACYALISRFCQKKKLKSVNFLLPNIAELRNFSLNDCLKACSEGILSVNYSWSHKLEKPNLLEKIHLIGVETKYAMAIKETVEIFESVYFARDLINGNADIVNPQYLCEAAKKLSEKFTSLQTTIFDRKRLEKEKMGLLLAVGQGSSFDPALIIVSYKGNSRSKDHTVIVGKGVTFDTGGLNLKPTGSMETMRADMSGAAAVLGTITAIASLKFKVNVTAVIPTCENAIGSRSFRPGDVYCGYLGKTVEIGNTDAEGRLILADALAYSAKNLSPTRMINLATLTGAARIALGEDIAALMSNNEELSDSLRNSGEATGELLWSLPLHENYKDRLKSDIADLKNVGGRSAGTILGGLFLESFVEKVPWAHLDIGSTAFLENEKPYLPKYGSGFGIRLLIDFLSKL